MVIPDPYSQDKSKKWYNQEVTTLHYAKYKVGESMVMVGVRPDAYGATSDFVNNTSWINVSDRLVQYPMNVSAMWIPWNEAGKPSYEVIFGVLKTLNYWIKEEKRKQIYIHCDGGTHRAVTLFGLYLMAYHPNDAININNNYELVNRQHWSNPLEYAKSYTDELNELPDLIKAIAESIDDENFGASLDDVLKHQVGEDKIKLYLWQRYINKTLPFALRYFLMDFKLFIKYSLFVHPYNRVSRYVHKKLNTKKGQQLKKMGF